MPEPMDGANGVNVEGQAMTTDEEEGCRIAKSSGMHTRRLLGPACCPYGSGVKAIYYEAWHEGWLEQDKRYALGVEEEPKP